MIFGIVSHMLKTSFDLGIPNVVYPNLRRSFTTHDFNHRPYLPVVNWVQKLGNPKVNRMNMVTTHSSNYGS